MELHKLKDHGGLPGEPRSYWVASTSSTRYPALQGEVTVDVAVVGGGMVGVTTAALLREKGYSVALLEATRLAQGVTGRTTAKISSLHGLIYAYLIDNFGREKARQYGEASQTAIETIADLVERHGIDCDFVRLPFYTFAQTDDGLRRVKEEMKAARDLGLPASYVDAIALSVPARGAVRFKHQAQFHPRKYLLGLARTIPGDDSFIFETSRVREITEGEPCELKTDTGRIHAKHVVIATHFPVFGLRAFYFARLHQSRHYSLALTIDEPFPQGMYIAAEAGGYSYRAAPSAEGTLVIVGGGHHKTGQGGDTRLYYQKLARHARQVYPAGRIRYHWATQDTVPLDRVPYIGKFAPGSEHLTTATGFNAWGMTNGTAAAMIIADLIHTGSNPWAPVFDPQRFTPQASARRFLEQNVDVAKAFVGGWISVENDNVASLEAGAGEVIEMDDQHVAVFRESEGTLHAVDPLCRHLGCTLDFNPAEKSWDCPCHGSRYAPDGTVLEAPTTEDLSQISLNSEKS
jgi:glycine/D-amino acid oxidase-like deaminating enzyme/nitrite reductase/ring-hydroxylating ferredoxin subunit